MQVKRDMQKVSASTSRMPKAVGIWGLFKRQKPLARVVLGLAAFVFLQAQVPYEYFEIEFIEPALVSVGASAGRVLPKGYGLDRDTGVAGALSLYDAFDPPVGSYQRQVVYEDIVFEGGQLSASARTSTPCELWSKNKNAQSTAKIWRRARFEIDSDGYGFIQLPSDSPDMVIESLSIERLGPQGYEAMPNPVLRRCTGDLYAIAAEQPGRYRIDYRTYSPIDTLPPREAGFFAGQKPAATLLDDESDRRVLSVLKGNKRLSQIMSTADPLPALILYFQAFESQKLGAKVDNGESLLSAILDEQRGLCRHRSLAFVAIARAWGYDVRIVTNEAHAFVEILREGRFYAVELGGLAESIDIRSPFAEEKAVQDFDFLGQNEAPPAPFGALGGDADFDSADGRYADGQAAKEELLAGTNASIPPRYMGNSEAARQVAQAASLGTSRRPARGGKRATTTIRALKDWLIFLPEETFSMRIVRDRQREFSGRLINYALMPQVKVRAELFLIYPDGERVFVASATSDKDGRLNFGFRLKPNAQLGTASFEIQVGGQRVLF